ncbi:hypothetical protein J0H58_28450 [bacterium]|nr:hypothetical protein [bacterium]
MAKKPAADTDALVTQALLTVATADHPPRLAGKGDTPALFASKTRANKAPIEALATFVTVSGKGADEAVQLTAAGFTKIAGQLPEDRVGPAAKTVAGTLPTSERVAFLQDIVSRTPVAAAELLPEYEAAVAAEKVEAETRVKEAEARREREERAKQAMVRWLELGEQRKQQRVAALLAELKAEGWKGATGGGDNVSPQPRLSVEPLTPSTPEEKGFRREVLRRLAAQWREAVEDRRDEPARFMEAGIGNVRGVRQIGTAGETTKFDGEFHEADEGVSTGAAVRVERPGWLIDEDDDRQHVILKARVAP